eukprot:9775918-Ditylum_brightwellii.AAC.1
MAEHGTKDTGINQELVYKSTNSSTRDRQHPHPSHTSKYWSALEDVIETIIHQVQLRDQDDKHNTPMLREGSAAHHPYREGSEISTAGSQCHTSNIKWTATTSTPK